MPIPAKKSSHFLPLLFITYTIAHQFGTTAMNLVFPVNHRLIKAGKLAPLKADDWQHFVDLFKAGFSDESYTFVLSLLNKSLNARMRPCCPCLTGQNDGHGTIAYRHFSPDLREVVVTHVEQMKRRRVSNRAFRAFHKKRRGHVALFFHAVFRVLSGVSH